MASLTKVSIISRKIIRYGIYFVILAVVARYSVQIGVEIYQRYNPEPPPPPTVGFGKLTELPFPEQEFPEDLTFTLETPEGGLPQLIPEGESVPVYFMPKLTTRLGVEDEANRKASALGFGSSGEPLTESISNIYIYRRGGQPQTLLINIITGIFSVSYDLNSDRSILDGIPPAEGAAVENVKNFLRGNLDPDISQGRSVVRYYRIEGSELIEAESLSEADVSKVNLFRRNYSEFELPSYTPEAIQANVWFNVASGGRIVNGEYHYYGIDQDQSETYPIISAEEAFNRLRDGNAFIANIDEDSGNEIVIRRVFLAYYDAGQYTEFYQPIVVFQGDNDFYAYVPAVTSEYYGE